MKTHISFKVAVAVKIKMRYTSELTTTTSSMMYGEKRQTWSRQGLLTADALWVKKLTSSAVRLKAIMEHK